MGFRRRMLDACGDVALPPWACAVSRSWSWNSPSATRTAPSPRWSPTVKNVQVAVRAAPIDVVPMSAQHRLCRLRGYAAVGLLGGCCCFWSWRCLWWTVRGRDGSGFREVGINRADWPILRVPTTEGVVMGSPKSKVEEVRVSGPLASHVAGFHAMLIERGYTPLSAVIQMRLEWGA